LVDENRLYDEGLPTILQISAAEVAEYVDFSLRGSAIRPKRAHPLSWRHAQVKANALNKRRLWHERRGEIIAYDKGGQSGVGKRR
jgi:hypothetical protein